MDTRLIAGEEPEMCQRLRICGYTILHIDQAMTLHDLAIDSFSQYWQRTERGGHALAEISTMFRDTVIPLWQHESRKNLFHASVLVGLFGIGLVMSLFLKAWGPLLLSVGLFALLSVRSAWKARWKSTDKLTLLFYGFHSQFQHIPATFGQLSYFYHHWWGKRRRLIEYK